MDIFAHKSRQQSADESEAAHGKEQDDSEDGRQYHSQERRHYPLRTTDYRGEDKSNRPEEHSQYGTKAAVVFS